MGYKVDARAKGNGGALSLPSKAFGNHPSESEISDIRQNAKSFYRQSYGTDHRGPVTVDIKISKD